MASREYRLEESIRFDGEFVKLEQSARNDEYRPAAMAFAKSLARVVALPMFLFESLFFSVASTLTEVKAHVNLGYAPDDYSHEAEASFQEEYRRLWTSLMDHHRAGDDPLGVVIGFGAKAVERYLENKEGAPRKKLVSASDGVEAVLSTMLTNAYSAFEALAGDLWVAALNKNIQLAQNFVNSAGLGKNLDLAVISGASFDLSRSMGSVLLQNKKVSFQAFKGIKDAYQSAFGEYVEPVLSDARALYEVEKIRHLLVHRAGLIDAKFISEMKDFAGYQDLQPGTYLGVTGPMVAKHVHTCSKAGSMLFKIVDAWPQRV